METFTLTTRQRRYLEKQLRGTHAARVYRRTLAVLDVAGGAAIAGVARRLRVTPRVVYYWIAAYLADPNPGALRDRARPGRPTRLTPADRGRLLGLLEQSPQDLGYFATEWTAGLLRAHLAGCTGRPLSDDTPRRELHRADYSCKRPRYALDPDPQVRGKKAADSAADPGAAVPQCRPRGRRN